MNPRSRFGAFWGSAARDLDETTSAALRLAPDWVLWPALQSIALGSGAFALMREGAAEALFGNRLALADTLRLGLWVATALAALVSFHLALFAAAGRIASRAGRERGSAVDLVAQLNERLRPVLALPLVGALRVPGIESSHPAFTLLLAGLLAACAGASAHAWMGPGSPRASTGALLAAASLIVALGVGAIAATPSALPDEVLLAHARTSPGVVAACLSRVAPTLALGAVLGAAFGWTTPAWLPQEAPSTTAPPRHVPSRRRERVADLAAAALVVASWAAYAIFFSRLAITNHHALHTGLFDLGIYDNIFWQSSHGHPLACSFLLRGWHGSAHFDPLLVVLSPLHRLYPRAELLLVLQAVWVGSGTVPAYLLGRSILGGRLPGLLVAATYALHPALHGATLYDFHSLTLVAPIVPLLLYCMRAGHRRAYFTLLVVALLVREDVALLLCFVGAAAVLTGEPLRVRLGWMTVAASLFWFGLVKRAFMASPDLLMAGKDTYSFAYYFSELNPNGNGTGGVALSLVTDPVFVLRTMLTEEKLVYLVTLFLPLGFLPLLARPGRIALVFGLLYALLASRSALYSVYFHYACLTVPLGIALLPEGLRRIEQGAAARGLDGRRLSRAWLAACAAATVAVSWKLGAIVPNDAFRGGFSPPVRALSPDQAARYEWLRAQLDGIPLSASVAATLSVGAHVADRERAFRYPDRTDVDWLVIDDANLARPNESSPPERLAEAERVRAESFRLVARRETIAILRRSGAP